MPNLITGTVVEWSEGSAGPQLEQVSVVVPDGGPTDSTPVLAQYILGKGGGNPGDYEKLLVGTTQGLIQVLNAACTRITPPSAI